MTAADPGGAGARLLRFLPLVAILAIMAGAYALGLHRSLSLDGLVQSRSALAARVEAAPLLSLLAFVAVYVATVALSLPGATLLTLAGGFLFGWKLGAAGTLVGATTGAVFVFLAARTALADTLRRKAGPFLARVAEGFRQDAFHYLLFLRLVPVFPFWLVNLAPALLGMRLAPFALATAIGILPGTIAFSVVGSGLDSVIDAQIAANPACVGGAPCRLSIDPSRLVTRELLAGLGALGLVALLPLALKAWRARRGR
ncbi:TVP38/TMEM64 family protein [Prosthecomicrobium sp. N25]|uniref:TVP38/TMEM64 family protein n=1 Tax=Prosthecomicrobium sp. N25 TaxID=3129254 RepID=UPI003077150C